MSYHEYAASLDIAVKDYPFYALIMAAMRQADSDNLARLQVVFPAIYVELQARYNSNVGPKMGMLESD